ncbi:hypothetical protein V6N13_028261 [Hibiscus sabdariffa]
MLFGFSFSGLNTNVDPVCLFVYEDAIVLLFGEGSERTHDLCDVPVVAMASIEGDWLWHKFDELLPPDIILRIADVKGPNVAISDDLIVWVGASDKRFSIAEDKGVLMAYLL